MKTKIIYFKVHSLPCNYRVCVFYTAVSNFGPKPFVFYILLIICNLKRQTVDCKVRLQPLSRNLLKFKLLQFKSTYCIYTLRSEYNFFFQCSLIESRICQKHPLYALQAQLNANIQQFENNLCFAKFLFVFGSREPKIASSCKNSIA